MTSISLIVMLTSVTHFDSAGIYLTAADFTRHHLSYSVADSQLEISGINTVRIRKADGQKLRFQRSAIYGVHKYGNNYRYMDETPALGLDAGLYKIEATAPYYVYSYSHVFSGSNLLFSLTPVSEPIRLTVENLAKYFPNQPEMMREIDQDKKLNFSMAARDPDGQLRVVKILAKYLPAPTR